MKRIIVFLLVLLNCFCPLFSDKKSEQWDTESRVYYKFEGIPGYVFFEGFDFKGYQGDSGGIEAMLARTLELLQQYYKSSGQPFVFVGHSQGGAA